MRRGWLALLVVSAICLIALGGDTTLLNLLERRPKREAIGGALVSADVAASLVLSADYDIAGPRANNATDPSYERGNCESAGTVLSAIARTNAHPALLDRGIVAQPDEIGRQKGILGRHQVAEAPRALEIRTSRRRVPKVCHCRQQWAPRWLRVWNQH
jgi:hypothetical protein